MRIVDAGYGHASERLLHEMLERPLFAHFATSGDDGPRVSPVWFLHEEDALWIVAQERDAFWKRVQGDSRCALEIVDFDLASGLVQMRACAARRA